MLGSRLAQFAWAFFGVGLSIALFAAVTADVRPWLRLGDPARTTGVILGCQATALREGGRRGGRVTPANRVYANRFRFDVAGRQYASVSYARGACLTPGTGVAVEYAADDPGVARIEGMRHSKAPGYAILFAFLLTAAGFGLVLFATTLGARIVRQLARGELVHGRLLTSEATRVSVDARTLMRLLFEIEHRGVVREVVVKTLAPERLEDDGREPLLFDPARPTVAMAWDTLPAAVALDERGELRAVPFARTLLVLLPAGVGVAGAIVTALL